MSGDTPGVIKTRKNALKHKCHEIEYLMCQDTRFVTRHESVSWDVACLRIVFDVSRHTVCDKTSALCLGAPRVLGHTLVTWVAPTLNLLSLT